MGCVRLHLNTRHKSIHYRELFEARRVNEISLLLISLKRYIFTINFLWVALRVFFACLHCQESVTMQINRRLSGVSVCDRWLSDATI